jgi:hypothetical protein
MDFSQSSQIPELWERGTEKKVIINKIKQWNTVLLAYHKIIKMAFFSIPHMKTMWVQRFDCFCPSKLDVET